MTQTMTLRIRYKPNTPLYSTTIEMSRDMTIEEVASAFADKCASRFNRYGKMNKRAIGKYRFGHYKLILQYLEAKMS